MSDNNTLGFSRAAFVAALLCLSAGAAAQQQLDVQTTVHKQVVVETEDGGREIQLVPAEVVVPGETVVYTITFENVGSEAAENIVITNPIDPSLEYVPGSATNGAMRIEFSADGGQTFGPASELRIVADGVERPATTADYTHVRWTLQTELEAGAKGSASFAAVLE